MSRPLPKRAMLVAAGLGTRLRPLTDRVPKCMVPVAGRPLIEHTVRWLIGHGVTEIAINLHHLPEQVRAHFGDGSKFGGAIAYSEEPTLLGTAGAVKKMEAIFAGAPFFVWYGDNLSRCDLPALWRLHDQRGGLATMALHHRDDPTQSGIVGLESDDRIVRFLEKPKPEQVFSHWVNAGILALESEVLGWIPPGVPHDFSREVFPAMIAQGQRLNGYRLSEHEGLWWIDTPADLARVQALDWAPPAGSVPGATS